MGAWLIFFMVCFAGIGFMFFCVLRRLDHLAKTISDDSARMRILLQAIGARMDAEPSGHEQTSGKPLSVEEALDAYNRKGAFEQELRDQVSSMPDLKF